MTKPTRIVYFTAGAAGMFCGSCMHDNTLARALIRRGCDVQLIPLYTPIRTDEPSAAQSAVFYGGINMFLQQKYPFFRRLPRWLDRWFDSPWLLRWAASRGMKTSAEQLGELTLATLQGEHGPVKKEMERLAAWLATQPQPDVVVFTNLLVAGCLPTLKRVLPVPHVVTLQGDDIFLDGLVEPYRAQVFREIARLTPLANGFLVNSEYYANYMSGYLPAPRERFRQVPLGIDVAEFATATSSSSSVRPPTIGYLARLAPEKGLQVLIEAFLHIHRVLKRSNVRLRIAGWLGEPNLEFAREQRQRITDAGLDHAVDNVGEVDRRGKIEFLQSVDVLSVPTTYREPKGLFVLEALAAGVPVVQPDHGAFSEMIKATGGGLLVPPHDPVALATTLVRLLDDRNERQWLSEIGKTTVHSEFSADKMADRTLLALEEIMSL